MKSIRFLCLASLAAISLSTSSNSWAQTNAPTQDDLPVFTQQDGLKTEQDLNIFQKIFPSLRPKDNFNPYSSMKAPFAQDTTPSSEGFSFLEERESMQKKMSEMQKNLDNSANAVPIHLPHANLDNIRHWVVTIASKSLTYSDNSTEELKDVLSYFSEDGRKDFLAFLQRNGIVGILKSKRYAINTILKEQPLMINEAEANGRYKWVFDVDLLTTYLPINVTNYQNTTARNDNFSIRMQITRAPAEENPKDGLLIEIWQVKDN